LATAFAVLSGVALLFSSQIRAAFARARRFMREAFGREGRNEIEAQAQAEDEREDEMKPADLG